MKKDFSGKFIVVDGPDGCGKSTQAGLLADWISSRGVDVCKLRDPGGTVIGEKVRKILLNPEHAAMCVRTELLLYMSARAQLWQEMIKPALEAGKCVVMDRWVSSTFAYQGFAGGFGVDNVVQIAERALERVWPDVTIILDVDQATAAPRMDRELDRMEQKGDDYHKKVRQGFLELAKRRDDVIVVDSRENIEQVQKKIAEELSSLV